MTSEQSVISAPGRRVVVVDDHPLIAMTLVSALRGVGLDPYSCDVDTANPVDAVSPGTLVLLDLDLGIDLDGQRVTGVGLLPVLRAAGATVLLVTGSTDESAIAAAIAGGAVGWVSKSAPFDVLLTVITDVAAGKPAITPEERDRLLTLHESRTRQCRDLDRRWARLTPRELVVLDRLVEGQRAATIAAEFVVSMATVRTQIRSILAKLEVGSQLEAVALARQRA